ncbi:3-hydroxyacyl-ACP dehydratase FabZ [Ostreibacterium oceani]|uniref:3-hydroxyacyl-[acyl-carrier-protein] dehydratase FabZ n=1 Tax=Ostreibacterium oceani TaxID=2654998 RepID=A0A6N7EXM3_9GAMM|nr:3-hydroxyacyl-ACP dehydratase FabZ [Ostreibacterium oceani]MPV85218.1 3-hydroxyacyl-ACP dehydratase FabZ [Ostreibacterium oceani]
MNSAINHCDVLEIMAYLPHRYPFLMLDKVVTFEKGKSLTAIKNVTVNEPFFTGHFPQKPVMPGVMILEAMAQATGILGFKSENMTPEEAQQSLYYFVGIDKARFKQVVVPGDQLEIEVLFERSRRGIFSFTGTARVDGKVACVAEIMCTRRPVDE